MKQKINITQLFKKEYPELKRHCLSKINKQIAFDLARFLPDDTPVLVAALVQNPFGKTAHMADIGKKFGPSVSKCVRRLNMLHSQKSLGSYDFTEIKNIAILYLINYKYIFLHKDEFEAARKMITPKKIRWAMGLLEKTDLTDLRLELEDVFFSYLEPEIYRSYRSLLKFTKEKYQRQQKEIVRDFQSMLRKNDIKAAIETRMKTISSIHNKITRKNLLFSQILDTIGLRIITTSEDDCYRAMVQILKNSPIITSKVKDYIAIPKENGYQSIHLTIIHENSPLEIQIRTREMHYQAQYGICRHGEYKINGPSL
jgi:(p)ppGpp synthase/HD superfamily hydrolase